MSRELETLGISVLIGILAACGGGDPSSAASPAAASVPSSASEVAILAKPNEDELRRRLTPLQY